MIRGHASRAARVCRFVIPVSHAILIGHCAPIGSSLVGETWLVALRRNVGVGNSTNPFGAISLLVVNDKSWARIFFHFRLFVCSPITKNPNMINLCVQGLLPRDEFHSYNDILGAFHRAFRCPTISFSEFIETQILQKSVSSVIVTGSVKASWSLGKLSDLYLVSSSCIN